MLWHVCIFHRQLCLFGIYDSVCEWFFGAAFIQFVDFKLGDVFYSVDELHGFPLARLAGRDEHVGELVVDYFEFEFFVFGLGECVLQLLHSELEGGCVCAIGVVFCD